MSNQIYLRQRKLNLKLPHSITVIGCGGTGSWVALFSSLLGIKHIILIDPDNIEEHNLNRQPYHYEHIGMPKTEALKQLLLQLRPKLNIRTYQIYATYETLKSLNLRTDIIFCCTDNHQARLEVNKYCKEHNIKAVYGYCYSDVVGIETPEEVEQTTYFGTGYTQIPQYLFPNVQVAILMWLIALNKVNYTSFECNLSELFSFNRGE